MDHEKDCTTGRSDDGHRSADAPSSPASAHVIEVTTSGVHSQYIGGAGTGHAANGTMHGHPSACSGAETHNGTGGIDFVDNHLGTCA